MHHTDNKDIICHNCGHPLRGYENHCPYCGQKNSFARLGVKQFFRDFAANFFNFDSRIWQTLVQLFKHPGKVSMQYIEGRRKRFTSPFRLLLQAGILYFLLQGITGLFDREQTVYEIQDMTTGESYSSGEGQAAVISKLDSLDQNMHFVEVLRNAGNDFASRNKLYNEVFGLIKEHHRQTSRISLKNGSVAFYQIDMYSILKDYLSERGVYDDYYPQIEDPEALEHKPILERLSVLFDLVFYKPYNEMETKDIVSHLQIKPSMWNLLIIDFSKNVYRLFVSEQSRNRFRKSIMSKVTLGLFFTLPVLAFFVWLSFYKRGLTYAETLVWIFYLQSLYFILMLAGIFFEVVLPAFLREVISMLLDLFFVVFLFRTLRYLYRQSVWITGLKLFLLVIPLYLLLAAFGVGVISLLSLLG